MKFLRVSVSAVALLAMLSTVACQAEEPEPEPAPVVVAPPAPEPEPEPEPKPGKGPECPTDHCVSVTVSGDLLFHQSLWEAYAIPTNEEGHSFDFVPLFEGLRPYLEHADLNICQAETPFSEFGGPYEGFPFFNTPPEVAVAAKKIGFDVCTTASNHSVDQGTEGLVRSLDLLQGLGLQTTGTYRSPEEHDGVLIVEANEVKIAIITSTFSLNGLYAEEDWQVDYPLEPWRVIEKAKQARAEGAEIVIVAFHAGEEYWNEPNDDQWYHAQELAESGVIDFMYSHHAHAIQPFEKVNGKWILYGTGNLISESAPPERYMNNEFLLSRIQFAKQADGTWEANDVSWTAATNQQDGYYKWCSVASDAPQGVCQWPEYDSEIRERVRGIVDMYGGADEGLREWLVTTEG